jgi:uncharacterized glyoxalase superfamily protein PhnB
MTDIDPIPPGRAGLLIPHLVCEGAAQAIDFYAEAFGVVEIKRSPTPDGSRLLHAELEVGRRRYSCAANSPSSLVASDATRWRSVAPASRCTSAWPMLTQRSRKQARPARLR